MTAVAGGRIVISDYIARLDAELTVPASVRRELLDEVRCGLHDAAAALETGMGADDAARAAVASFGDPREIAEGLGQVHAAACVRRCARATVLFLPVQFALWALLWATQWAQPAGHHGGLPLGWIYLAVTAVPVGCALLVLSRTDGPELGGRHLRVVSALHCAGTIGGGLIVAVTVSRFVTPIGTSGVQVLTSSVWAATLHVVTFVAMVTLLGCSHRAARAIRRVAAVSR